MLFDGNRVPAATNVLSPDRSGAVCPEECLPIYYLLDLKRHTYHQRYEHYSPIHSLHEIALVCVNRGHDRCSDSFWSYLS